MRNSPYSIHNQMKPSHWNPEIDGSLEMAVKPTISLESYEDHLAAPTLCVRQVKYWEQSATSICSGVRREHRKADLSAANKVKGKAGGFLRSAAMKALNNLSKIELFEFKTEPKGSRVG